MTVTKSLSTGAVWARTIALSISFLILAACGGAGSVVSKLFGTPTITSVAPNPVSPGGTITITGTNFNGVNTTVYFHLGDGVNQVNATAGNYTTITAVVPSTLAAGAYSIDVVSTNSSGIGSAPSNSVPITIN